MKRMDCPLKSVPDMVAACIVLHNICILSKDKFDREWIQIGEEDLERIITDGELIGG